MREIKDKLALVISVGGSPKGQAESIASHRPDHVVFFASEQSVEKVPEILQLAQSNEYTVPSRRNIVTPDEERLNPCYQNALRAIEAAREEGYSGSQIMVDYTGGTKTMSASILLAAIRTGCRFSYVGGHQRNKNGLGIVMDGTERVLINENPWDLYGIQYRQQFAFAFNRYQFSAASGIAGEARLRCIPAEESLWATLALLCDGYSAWERFAHADALRQIKRALERLQSALRGSSGLKPSFQETLNTVVRNRDWLEELTGKAANALGISPHLIEDLLANAERRAEEGKYDDAVARLYRSLEMIGQAAFFERFGIGTSNVPPETIPETIRSSYRAKYATKDKQGKEILRLGLDATFTVLAEAKVEAGLHYVKHRDKIKDILRERNDSILAHGSQPVTDKKYARLRDLLKQLFQYEAKVKFARFDENA